MSQKFVRIAIDRNDGGQFYLILITEDGNEEQYRLKDFPHNKGGPVIIGDWNIEKIEKK
jgi:hypothetical protein